MKRKNFALITLFALVIGTFTPLQLNNLVSGNFYPTPSLFLEGPTNTAFPNGCNFTFEVHVHIPMDSPAIVSISYSLDECANLTFTSLGYTTWYNSDLPNNHKIFSMHGNLDNLSDGNHTLKVYSLDAKGAVMSDTRTFTVDRNFKLPAISIISPLNQSYSKNEIPLTYTIDAQTTQIKWAYFTLDSIESDSYMAHNFNGNITLSNLADGSHSIKLEVLTEKGISKQITYFNIDTTAQAGNALTLNNQTNIIVIGIVAITIVAVPVVLIYSRKKTKLTN
jgi:hypothetical protein